MIAASWVCLLSPLAAALAITLLGHRLTRRGAAFLASGSVLVSFIGALVAFIGLLGESSDARSHLSTGWEWLTAGDFRP